MTGPWTQARGLHQNKQINFYLEHSGELSSWGGGRGRVCLHKQALRARAYLEWLRKGREGGPLRVGTPLSWADRIPAKTRSGRFTLAHGFRGPQSLGVSACGLMGSEEKCHHRKEGLRKAAHSTADRKQEGERREGPNFCTRPHLLFPHSV